MSDSEINSQARPRNAAKRAAEDDVMQIQWTDERPTEPGEYWVSLHPSSRRQDAMATDDAVSECRLAPNGHRLSGRDRDGAWSVSIDDPLFDGAKWSRRETPADPFEVTT